MFGYICLLINWFFEKRDTGYKICNIQRIAASYFFQLTDRLNEVIKVFVEQPWAVKYGVGEPNQLVWTLTKHLRRCEH